jgi:hypothetical protein
MQDQSPSGEKNPLGIPSAATVQAWANLASTLAADRGVLAELFNEPIPQYAILTSLAQPREGVDDPGPVLWQMAVTSVA